MKPLKSYNSRKKGIKIWVKGANGIATSYSLTGTSRPYNAVTIMLPMSCVVSAGSRDRVTSEEVASALSLGAATVRRP